MEGDDETTDILNSLEERCIDILQEIRITLELKVAARGQY